MPTWYTVGKPMVYLSSIRLCRERFEMLQVAMIKDRGNADFTPLVVLGNNKTSIDAIKESILDAYRQTLPGWITDYVTIQVKSIGDNTYILNSWATDENNVLTHHPVVCLVKIVSTPLYGKVD